MDKLDLLAKGWKVSEIEHASKILEEAENSKKTRTKFIDNFLIVVLVSLMILNGFVCATFLVPFIYGMNSNMSLIIAATIGVIFSAIFTLIIYDIEKIRHKHDSNLFIMYIVNGVVNFYLILEFSARFGAETKLPLLVNIYVVAGIYLLAFLTPQVIYRLRSKEEPTETIKI